MKKRHSLFLLTLFITIGSIGLVNASHTAADVYLLGGQSNMQGSGKLADLPEEQLEPLRNIFFWNGKTFEPLIPGKIPHGKKGRLGPEIGFATEMAKIGRTVFLIKHSASGMPLDAGWNGGSADNSSWKGDPPAPNRATFYPGLSPKDPARGKLYKKMLSHYQAGIAALKKEGCQVNICGFVWMQGEQDSKVELSAGRYAQSLKRLRDRLAEDLGFDKGEELPFVFGQVLPHTPALERFVCRDTIRAQQTAADMNSGSNEAIPNALMVSTDSFPLNNDTVHYNAVGQILLGTAFAKKLIELNSADVKTTVPQAIPADSRTAFEAQRPAPHVLADPDYFCWGLTVIHWTDGKYYGYYARWPKAKGFNAWLTHCEIAHAVADHPEGPFITQGTVVDSRHLEGWDIVTAHNPSVCVAQGKIHLYYISNKLRGEFEQKSEGEFPSDEWLKKNRREIVRNRQCIGVASADTPAGPFVRSPKPVVVPHGRFKNIAVNPAVIYRDGTFIMIAKGDDVRRDGWFRIQLVGHADHAAGPFIFQDEPIYDKAQTEDACLWYNRETEQYNMVCHVMGKRDLALFTSRDSMIWEPGSPPVFMKKIIPLDDGTDWKPQRLERPFVLTDERGRPIMIYVSVMDKGGTGNIAIPLGKTLSSTP